MVILLFVLYKCVLTVREESESDDDDDVELFSGLPTFGLGHLEARLSLD
jgi:hypothetical protein